MKKLMIINCVILSNARNGPLRATNAAAGFDLFADRNSAMAIAMPAFSRLVFDTGVKMAIPEGYAGFIWPRSGLAVKHGIQVLGGLIDSDYRGEIKVCLYNGSGSTVYIDTSRAIAQIVIQRHETPVFRLVSELPDSARGEGRFGSTDEDLAASANRARLEGDPVLI